MTTAAEWEHNNAGHLKALEAASKNKNWSRTEEILSQLAPVPEGDNCHASKSITNTLLGQKVKVIDPVSSRIDNPYGPAIVLNDGTRKWYRAGMLHNASGPAVLKPDGKVMYYYLGTKCKDAEYLDSEVERVNLHNQKSRNWLNTRTPKLSDTELKNLKIFVIDDDEVYLATITASFKQLGITNVSTESNSEKILELSGETELDFDIIFCDLNMPNIDGLTVLQHLVKCKYSGFILLMSGIDRRILNSAATFCEALGLRLLGATTKPITLQSLQNYLIKTQKNVSELTQKDDFFEITEHDLINGIEKNEFKAHYQPQISALDKSLTSVETLTYWEHPKYGLIPTKQFFSMTEEIGLVSDIFNIVFLRAIHDTAILHRKGHQIRISVNIFTHTLCRPGLIDFIADACKKVFLPPRFVCLEVTESQLMTDIHLPLAVLCRLSMMGFRLSLDNFGSGYSSMGKLATYPFHELKIDGTFANGAAFDDIARTIIETNVILGHKLNMEVVAIDVENQKDCDAIIDAGVNMLQGNLFGKPMSCEELNNWISN